MLTKKDNAMCKYYQNQIVKSTLEDGLEQALLNLLIKRRSPIKASRLVYALTNKRTKRLKLFTPTEVKKYTSALIRRGLLTQEPKLGDILITVNPQLLPTRQE